MTMVGIAAGLGLALALSSLLGKLLYAWRRPTRSPFVAVAMVLASVATLAAYLPVRRASRMTRCRAPKRVAALVNPR